jgi:phenylpropionate dioxygenase-like ring-hydroxylating dioxygenase large terminal subunit
VDLRQFWYVIAESSELKGQQPLGTQVLDEWIVCFRNTEEKAVAFPDRCLHRCGRLSRGSVVNGGELKCPYHGWQYDGSGKVVALPSEGGREAAAKKNLRTHPYETREQDGYVYVRLATPDNDAADPQPEPFAMPHWQKPGWQNLRLVHDFGNTVTNCVENFIDVPHTAFVHHGIFRKEASQRLEADVRRADGEVHISYRNEKDNLGSFSWFLNPKGDPVFHTDSFLMPNITHVVYRVGKGERVEYLITSQSVPMTDDSTRVYTDITFRFGAWSWFARPFARHQAKRVIRQDIEELDAQMEVIQKYGQRFIDTPADRIHHLVTEIRDSLIRGEDPRTLPNAEETVEFWV